MVENRSVRHARKGKRRRPHITSRVCEAWYATYDSTHIFDEFGVVRLPRISPIAAYMKLWMYAEEENLPSLLLSPRGGDIF